MPSLDRQSMWICAPAEDQLWSGEVDRVNLSEWTCAWMLTRLYSDIPPEAIESSSEGYTNVLAVMLR